MRARATAKLSLEVPAGRAAGRGSQSAGAAHRAGTAILRPAAVLIPIVARPEGATILLTQRASALSRHAGQIAFPGGRIDATDATPLAAALRETEEEIGLTREAVTPLGYLDPYFTGSGYRILPVVAIVTPPFALLLNPAEVEEAFEVPAQFLMDPRNHVWQVRERDGRRAAITRCPSANATSGARRPESCATSMKSSMGEGTSKPMMDPTAAPPRLVGGFMDDPKLARVFAALDWPGEETRVVGGAIRNALLGEKVTEIDLATTASPELVLACAKRARLKCVPTGIDHGTVTIIVEGRPFEVTTLREDVETDGRRAKVRFGRDFEADAWRRDFTINALSAGRDGRIFDYTGGLADLAARRIRFIGSARQRIARGLSAHPALFPLSRRLWRRADGRASLRGDHRRTRRASPFCRANACAPNS